MMCQHHTCSDKYTQFEKITFNGMKIIICLCDKHAEKWDENYYEELCNKISKCKDKQILKKLQLE